MNSEQLRALGLVFGQDGRLTGVDVGISSSVLLADGYARRVRLQSLTIDASLEMTVAYERYFVDDQGRDAFAQVQADTTLAPTAQRERLSMLQPIYIFKTTAGAFRSSVTGEVVEPTDPDAVPELLFFQHMALPQLQQRGLPLTGSEPYLLVVYLMLANIIREKDALGEF